MPSLLVWEDDDSEPLAARRLADGAEEDEPVGGEEEAAIRGGDATACSRVRTKAVQFLGCSAVEAANFVA